MLEMVAKPPPTSVSILNASLRANNSRLPTSQFLCWRPLLGEESTWMDLVILAGALRENPSNPHVEGGDDELEFGQGEDGGRGEAPLEGLECLPRLRVPQELGA